MSIAITHFLDEFVSKMFMAIYISEFAITSNRSIEKGYNLKKIIVFLYLLL